MSTVAIIPARGGSKGIPNKNLALLCGRPLIEYSLKIALKSSSINHIIVTSDSDEILRFVKDFDNSILTVRRPAELATDSCRTESAVLHAINDVSNIIGNIEYFVLLQPTSPLRKVEFIEECISLIKSSNKSSLLSVSDPIQHPYDFLFTDNGRVSYICREDGNFRRQNFRDAKFINGSIYITKRDLLFNSHKIYSLESCVLYDMPILYSIDIDTKFDLMMCEALMRHEKVGDFE